MPRLALATLLLSLTACFVAQAPALALPDAALARIDVLGTDLRDGDRVTITVTVSNRGDAPLPPVPVVLSIGGEQYAEWKLPSALAPGASVTWSQPWRAKLGSHVVRATVDPLNDVIESNETDNSSFINLGVGEPPSPSPWPPALAGLGAFVLGVIVSVLVQRLRPRPRPDQRYAIRREAKPPADPQSGAKTQ
jgi:subtilase family serine protease